MKPLVSIVIPHFNRGVIIQETLCSIKNQTYPHFECLIIDDHSTDDSIELIDGCIGNDTRFTLLKRNRQPKGAPVCRNIGIQMAKGDYLMFLDSDDLMAPFCLEQRVALFQRHPSHDFIVCQTALFRSHNYLADRLHSSLLQEDDLMAFINMHGWGTSSTFFSASYAKTLSFDEKAGSWQDIEFHIRLLLKHPSYKKFPDSRPDVFKRFGEPNQISATNRGYDRLSSLLSLFLRLEVDLADASVDFKSQFLMFYFKFLEIAARTESYSDFKKLMKTWEQSSTYHHPGAKLFRTYLSTQALLTKFGLYKLGSIPYRLIRPVFPNQVLNFTAKNVLLEHPVDLRKMDR